MLHRFFFAALVLLAYAPNAGWAAGLIAEDKSSGVILSYSRVGEDIYPETNITVEQFESHIHEILSGDYHVVALPDLIRAVKDGEDVAHGTLAITFEGAYRSAYENAIPLLLQHKLPFTVFYASDYADSPSGQYMDWDTLRFLQKQAGVTLGILPASYVRLSRAAEEDIRSDINRAQAGYRERFGGDPVLFSYPYGEYSPRLKEIVGSYNFQGAVTLNSGALSPQSDFMSLPRFPMTERYGDLRRFRLVSQALPLPVSDLEPEAPVGDFDTGDTGRNIGFSVTPSLQDQLGSLSCYVSGQEVPNISVIGPRVEIRPAEALSDERTRINCTMPGPLNVEDDSPTWRWLGMLLVKPLQDAPQ